MWARPRYLALILTGLAVALAVAVIGMHSYSANQYQRAIEIRELDIEAYDLMAAGWRTVNDYAFPAQPGFSDEAWAAEKKASLEGLANELADYRAHFRGEGPEN